MKIAISFFLVLSFFPLFSQFDGENDSVIYVAKPDSVFWVDDLKTFAKENELYFLNEENEVMGDSAKSLYLLAKTFYYPAAYMRSDAVIAIKEKNKYRVWGFSDFVPQFSEIYEEDFVTINNRRFFVLIGAEVFMKHGYYPVMNNYNACSLSLNLFDIDNNEVIFSKTFSQSQSIDYLWDFAFDTTGMENPISKEEFDKIYTHDTTSGQRYFILPRTKDTIDLWEYPDTSTGINYDYRFNKNKIEFYLTEGSCDGEYLQGAIKPKLALKPNFWYEYIEKERKWVKKN